MDCKQAEKLIPQFLNNSIEPKVTNSFLEHMDSCESCMEELSIQYLVMTGTTHLEDGDSYDLQAELDKKMINAKKAVKRRIYTVAALYFFEIAAIAMVIFLLVMVVLK